MQHSFPHLGVSLRNRQPEDKALEFELYASTRAEEMQAWGLPPEQQQLFLQMQFDAQHRGHRAAFPSAQNQIILKDGQPIGHLVMDRGDEVWTLVDIALFLAYRGAGIGSSLLGAVLDEAAIEGKTVQLHVWTQNPAQRLYQRLGFETCGGDGVHIEMRWTPPNRKTVVEATEAN